MPISNDDPGRNASGDPGPGCECRGSLLCALVLIALGSAAIGAAGSHIDLHVADIVATAMRPIA